MNVSTWTERLPQNWNVLPLKYVAEITNSNVDKKSYDDGIPVRLCNYTDVYYNDYITSTMDMMFATATATELRRFSLRRGDVIITKDSESWNDIAVPACVAEDLDGVVCGYHLTMVRPWPDVIYGPYLLRCLQASGIREQLWTAANGVTRFGLGQQGIRDALVPLPPMMVQRAIADFLDRKTAAIDALIEKKERLITLLAEKRAALIHRAVTKGLHPDAPIEDSGIPWIGEIPAHWAVHQLRRVVSEFVDYRGRTPDKSSSGIPLITAGAVRNGEIDHSRVPEWVSEETYEMLSQRGGPAVGDLLFTSEAPLGEVGLVVDPKIACAQRIILFKANRCRVLPQYLRLHFLAETGKGEVRSRASGSTAEGIRADRLKMSLVPTPPLGEQNDICAYVESRTRGFDTVSIRVQVQIDRLREYRQALITAAVTGQLNIGEPSP